MHPKFRRSGLLLVSILPVLAQAQDFTLRVEVPLVSIDVSVTDRTGQPVEGLGVADFEVFENGVRQEIRYFGSSSAPYHVYLLFDASGSTRHKWDFMSRAAAGFVEFIRPQDRVSIGIFDDRLKTLSGWKDSRETALDALDPSSQQWKSGGTTEFYRSLENAIKKSFDDISERRALIVLTDGRDTSLYREIVRHNRVMLPEEDRRFKNLYRTAAETHIPIYFIAVNTDFNLDANPEGADEHRNLQIIYRESSVPDLYLEQVRIRMKQVAEISGGRVLFPKTLAEVAPLFEQVGSTLSRAYSLGYIPKIGRPDDQLRRIVVKVENENYTIRQSRAGYYVVPPNE
jgi:Ca-activated chloride channel family protein